MLSHHEPKTEHAKVQTQTQTQQQSSIMKIGSICLILVAIGIIAVFFFKVPFGTLLFAAIALACPLLHILMMKSGGHKH